MAFVHFLYWTVELLTDIYLHIPNAYTVISIQSFYLIESLINFVLTCEMLYEFVF